MKSIIKFSFIYLFIFGLSIFYNSQLLLADNSTTSSRVIVSYQSDVTPLHQAALEGRLNDAMRLVSEGADIEAKTNNGVTPIHSASAAGKVKIVKFLISKNANVSTADNRGVTALHSAAMEGYIEVAELLIAGGADLNRKTVVGNTKFTPLGLAKLLGKKEMVLFLEKHGGRE